MALQQPVLLPSTFFDCLLHFGIALLGLVEKNLPHQLLLLAELLGDLHEHEVKAEGGVAVQGFYQAQVAASRGGP